MLNYKWHRLLPDLHLFKIGNPSAQSAELGFVNDLHRDDLPLLAPMRS
jgi:hypothetical protein